MQKVFENLRQQEEIPRKFLYQSKRSLILSHSITFQVFTLPALEVFVKSIHPTIQYLRH